MLQSLMALQLLIFIKKLLEEVHSNKPIIGLRDLS